MNALTISYFQVLLERLMKSDEYSMSDDSISVRMEEANRFLLQLGAK